MTGETAAVAVGKSGGGVELGEHRFVFTVAVEQKGQDNDPNPFLPTECYPAAIQIWQFARASNVKAPTNGATEVVNVESDGDAAEDDVDADVGATTDDDVPVDAEADATTDDDVPALPDEPDSEPDEGAPS